MATPSFTPRDLIEGNIFDSLGLQNLSDEQKQTTMARLIDGVQNRVLLRIDDLLDEHDAQGWQHVLESGDDNQIRHFLDERNIHLDQLVAEEALLLKRQLLGFAQAAHEQG